MTVTMTVTMSVTTTAQMTVRATPLHFASAGWANNDLSQWEDLNFHASLNGVPWRRRPRLEEMMELVDL